MGIDKELQFWGSLMSRLQSRSLGARFLCKYGSISLRKHKHDLESSF